jgi:hypothetical protein
LIVDRPINHGVAGTAYYDATRAALWTQRDGRASGIGGLCRSYREHARRNRHGCGIANSFISRYRSCAVSDGRAVGSGAQCCRTERCIANCGCVYSERYCITLLGVAGNCRSTSARCGERAGLIDRKRRWPGYAAPRRGDRVGLQRYRNRRYGNIAVVRFDRIAVAANISRGGQRNAAHGRDYFGRRGRYVGTTPNIFSSEITFKCAADGQRDALPYNAAKCAGRLTAWLERTDEHGQNVAVVIIGCCGGNGFEILRRMP